MRLPVMIAGCVLLLTLAGCIAAPPPPMTSLPSDSFSAVPGTPVSLSGELRSQGAATAGTVSVVPASADEFAVVLTDFSTGAGTDLRLNLSPGKLVKGADGYSVDGDISYELPGTVDPSDPTQVFLFPMAAWPDSPTRSFTVYDYANRVAFGSAAMEPADVTLPAWASAHIRVVDGGTRPGASGALLPVGGDSLTTYVAAAGDTAADIAARFDVGLEQLVDEGGLRLGRYPEIFPNYRIQFGTPLIGPDYDCFFGSAPATKGESCYSS